MKPLPPVPNSLPEFDWFNTLRDIVRLLRFGTGSPAGVVVANIGTLYLRSDGGASTTLYVKEADNGAATGWRAV